LELDGTRVIAHICNDIGKWGAGFSGAISRRWKDPEEFYKKQYKHAKNRFKLGRIQWVFVDLDLAIVNMIAQEGVRSVNNPNPIRYDALESCLNRLSKGCRGLIGDNVVLKTDIITIHMPRIGTGLAGGSWDRISGLIDETLWDFDVYVYDFSK